MSLGLRDILAVLATTILFVLPLIVSSPSQAEEMSSSPQENCISLKAERKQACEKAYHICTEVHEKYAFNEIRSCAHYSEQCHIRGQKEDRFCDETQVSMKEIH